MSEAGASGPAGTAGRPLVLVGVQPGHRGYRALTRVVRGTKRRDVDLVVTAPVTGRDRRPGRGPSCW